MFIENIFIVNNKLRGIYEGKQLQHNFQVCGVWLSSL